MSAEDSKELAHRIANSSMETRASDDSPAITTQLFIPGERRNRTDSIFDSSLVMNVEGTDSGEKATFNFVLDVD